MLPETRRGSVAEAHAAELNGWFLVNYNPQNMLNSEMWAMQGLGGLQRWRTGSGNFGPGDRGHGDPRNECLSNRGHAPRGSYRMRTPPYHQMHFNGSEIKGRVWRLDDKKCNYGTTVRTELFVHTEELSNHGQDPNREAFRWDGPNDYRSEGCWKVARHENGGDNGVALMAIYWNHFGGRQDTRYDQAVLVACYPGEGC